MWQSHLFLHFGSVFLSFLVVFIIAYDKHDKQNAAQSRMAKEPLRTALVAFILFFCLAAIAGYLFF